jgi:hypothetical protein
MVPNRFHYTFLLLLILVTSGARAETPSSVSEGTNQDAATHQEESKGVLYFTMENDSLFDKDSNYTSGLRLNWLSRAVDDTMESDHGFTRKMVQWTSFLPFVGNSGYRNHLSLGLASAMFTPYNTWVRDPPPDDRPYAGITFFDGGVHAYTTRWLHSYNLWLGLVGPASGAEWLQRQTHDLFGRQFPNGWETQLENEPILNVFYQARHKLINTGQGRAMAFDLIWNGGFGFGNWYTGANVGLVARFGHNLLSDFGATAIYQPGSHHGVLPISKPEKRPSCYLWAGADGSVMARDLSLDGNTFKESRSVEKKPMRGSAAVGLNASWRRMMLSFSLFFVSDTYETQKSSNHFGSLTLYYFF